jgi:hypothetical protein
MRYLLIIFVLAAFVVYPLVLGEGYIDFGGVLACLIVAGFQVLSSIWLYKDFVGWDKFEYSEGLRLKRKKDSK